MKSRFQLIAVLIIGAILLGASSCATVSTEPLAPGELRLLRASIPRSGILYLGTSYEVEITFQADAHPTIRRACFFFSGSGEGPSCYAVKPKYVEFGSPGSLRVTLPPPIKSGTSRLECFAEYWQGTKILRTNVIHSSIDAL